MLTEQQLAILCALYSLGMGHYPKEAIKSKLPQRHRKNYLKEIKKLVKWGYLEYYGAHSYKLSAKGIALAEHFTDEEKCKKLRSKRV